MGLIIVDGKGRGNAAEVNDENELVVRAITEAEIEHASSKLGTAFTFDSGERDIDATDTMLFVKNTAVTPLICDRILFNGSNAICTWEVYIGSDATTPSGTSVTPTNMNREFSSKLCECVAYYDETAVADGTIVCRVKTPIDGYIDIDATGIILGKNHYIQINQLTESTRGSIILIGHFEVPS